MLVHSDPVFAAQVGSALVDGGFSVACFDQPRHALDALERGVSAKVLITRVNFGPDRQNGIGLALSAGLRDPDLRVLFTSRSETADLAQQVGDVLVHPVSVEEVVATVRRMASLNEARTE